MECTGSEDVELQRPLVGAMSRYFSEWSRVRYYPRIRLRAIVQDQTHNSYVDIIGTKGIVRMTHDFKTAVVELHGVNQTLRVEKPFGGNEYRRVVRLVR